MTEICHSVLRARKNCCLSVYTPLSAQADDVVEAELILDFLQSFSLYAIVWRMFVVSADGNWAFTARLFKHKKHHLVFAVTITHKKYAAQASSTIGSVGSNPGRDAQIWS